MTPDDPPSPCRDIMATTAGLAAASGMDVTRCEFCGKKLNKREPWRRGLDGAGAHKRCIAEYFTEEAKG